MFRQELPNLCVEYQSNEALAGTRAVPRISRSDLVLWAQSGHCLQQLLSSSFDPERI